MDTFSIFAVQQQTETCPIRVDKLSPSGSHTNTSTNTNTNNVILHRN